MSAFKQRVQQALTADFLIERELGGGGMSRVFLATERALERRVVIKVLPPELAAGVNVERFRREIQLAAQLQHPLIVPLLAAGEDGGLLWFSMPYIEGDSLRDALDQRGRMSPRDVVRILHDVVDALAYAHARGVVHRDIKPDNILTSGMHALVTDFGVAKALRASIPLAGGTATGMAIGTPAYMAPEQLAADPAADHRVDIYAVGLLAYELLAGRSPFSGASPQATLAAQLTQMPEPPHRSIADIPEALSALIMRCLAKDATERPASATALLTAIEALPLLPAHHGGNGGAPVRPGGAADRRTPTRRWPMAAALLSVGAVATWLLLRPPSTTSRPGAADSLTARDAGPGGDRSQRLRLDSTVAGPPVHVDTIVIERGATDAARGVAVPVVITRAESLAIAASFRRRTDTGTTMADARALDRAQLLEEVGRVLADSVSQAILRLRQDTAFSRSSRGLQPATGGPTARVTPILGPVTDGRARVVVTTYKNSTGRRDLVPAIRSLSRFLRDGLPTERFTVVDSETTARASRAQPDPMAMGWSLRADYVISGVVLQRADSIVWLTMLTDLRGRFSRAGEVLSAQATPTAAFDASLLNVKNWLDSAAVRRRSAGNGTGRRRLPGPAPRS
ncbi:MAG: serine/threonine-protein kinase [Gemmatimonadaceae bacterium]